MTFKGIIFDIDGTLVNSVDIHAEAWAQAFRKFGYAFPLSAIRQQIGKGSDQLMPAFLSREEIETDGKDLEWYQSGLFKRDYLPSVHAFPGVRRLFQRIRQQGHKIALASSASGDEVDEYKRIAEIAELVDVTITADDADKSKPHPDIFAAALERLDRHASEALVVGDTRWDAEAAGKLGISTIGLLCGGTAEEVLLAAGCVAIYRDPVHLLAEYEFLAADLAVSCHRMEIRWHGNAQIPRLDHIVGTIPPNVQRRSINVVETRSRIQENTMAKLKTVIERSITNAAEAVGDVIDRAGALVGRRAATKPASTKKATRRKPAARKATSRKAPARKTAARKAIRKR